jgi:hypothetical protein
MPTLHDERYTNNRLICTGSDRHGREQGELATLSSAALEMTQKAHPVHDQGRDQRTRRRSRRSGKRQSLALKAFDHEDYSDPPSSPASAAPHRLDDTGV